MFKLTAVSALASVVCLSVGQHVFAADLDVVTDRNFFEGIFAGDVSPAEAPVDEYLRMYDGPLPAYRDPSYWGLFEYRARKGKPVSEKDVYHAFLRHYNETGNKDWEIGIGAGGQLYSWRGPWGEAIPPQNNPWNDEVWQAVMSSPDARQLHRAMQKYDKYYLKAGRHKGTVGVAFVHGSGSHIFTKTPQQAVFIPMLARWYDADSKSYHVINLGQSPHQPTVLHHRILFYARYRYLGNGVLEVTNVFYNFGEYEYGVGGSPWGGVRTSVFPELFISDTNGVYHFIQQYYGEKNTHRRCIDSDGWMGAAAKKDDPDSPAFAFAYGRDYTYDKGDLRGLSYSFGRAGRTADGKPNKRDYTVMANSVGYKLKSGDSCWVRYYLIVGKMADVVKKARVYGKKADFGALALSEGQATVQPLYLKKLKDRTVSLSRNGEQGAKPVCRVYNEPVLNSKPLFVIREMPAGRSLVTTDSYGLSKREPYKNPLPKGHDLYSKLENTFKYQVYNSQNGKLLKWELLGFVMPKKHVKLEKSKYVPISNIVSVPESSMGMLVRSSTEK